VRQRSSRTLRELRASLGATTGGEFAHE